MTHPHAAAAYLLDPDGLGRIFAFGLNWSPLIGSQVAAMARSKARRQRATHYVAGGLRASAVGCARLPGTVRKRSVYSAAQAFALWHSHEALICIAQVPDGRVWMAAAQDGAVIARTDILYRSLDEAQDAARALMTQRPSLRLCDGAETLRALLSRVDESAALIPVRSRWARIPLPIRIVVLALSLSFGVSLLRQPATPSTPARHGAAKPDQAHLWQQALVAFSQAHPIHTSQDLQRVFAAMHRLPLTIQGWIFRSARCQAIASGWDCSALYSRLDAMATNADFNALVPQGWRAEFKPLNEALVSWTLESVPVPLALNDVPPGRHVDTVLTSTLQRLQPLFSQVVLGAPEALVMSAPIDENGLHMASPNDLPRLRRRALSLNGPLRSFSLLPDYTNAARVAWTGLSLQAEPGRKPDMAVSALTAQLQGFIYEKE